MTTPANGSVAEVPPTTPPPVVVLSELDSYITERMKGQPATLAAVEDRAERRDLWSRSGHRLKLPDYFKPFAYESEAAPGPYVFRWIYKEKRAIDRALNVLGWTLVTRVYFPDAPRYLFTANGGVEVGDAILAFIPSKRALAIRDAPAKKSLERIKAQMTVLPQRDGMSPPEVLMTGHPDAPHIYKPNLGKSAEDGGGVVVETGSDF